MTTCHVCNGSGKCTKCEGVGFLARSSRIHDHPNASQAGCEPCDGTGNCPKCNGKGRIERKAKAG